MQLIDDIQEAAERGSHAYCTSADWEAYVLASSPWMARIRAALLAADLMAHRMRNDYEPGHPAWSEMESFRAATEGKP